jgi:hypothetical protein
MPIGLKSTLTLLGAAAILAGCGGTDASPTGSLPAANVSVPAAFPNRSASWMMPETKSTSLLYVSNAGSSDVTIYTYLDGKGLVLVGQLTGFSFPTGMCTDGAGDVWIPDYDTGKIQEFTHGGASPIFTISERTGHPYDCAIDSNTGSLAVANQQPGNQHALDGQVVVYPKGSHQGRSYAPQHGFGEVDFLAYDDKSNLFADGAANDYGNGLFELAKGGTELTPLTISGATLYSPGAVNWIKPTLLVGDQNLGNRGEPGAYKFFISGSTATVVGSLMFAGTQQMYGFWRRAGLIVVPDHLGNVVRIYSLSDGTLVSKFGTEISLPFGAVVSQ